MANKPVEQLKEAFDEWLQMHELDFDCWVYAADEWRKRGESVLSAAEWVFAFDNQLVDILNYSGRWEVEEELQDLANSFGYYFEFGNHWNIGFFPLDTAAPMPSPSASYPSLLKDERWRRKRARILKRCHNACEECDRTDASLEVHHCYYRYPRLPWQYPDGALLALCRSCHVKRQREELCVRMLMTRLRTRTLSEIRASNKSLARDW